MVVSLWFVTKLCARCPSYLVYTTSTYTQVQPSSTCHLLRYAIFCAVPSGQNKCEACDGVGCLLEKHGGCWFSSSINVSVSICNIAQHWLLNAQLEPPCVLRLSDMSGWSLYLLISSITTFLLVCHALFFFWLITGWHLAASTELVQSAW
jgi:hypothetical protein